MLELRSHSLELDGMDRKWLSLISKLKFIKIQSYPTWIKIEPSNFTKLYLISFRSRQLNRDSPYYSQLSHSTQVPYTQQSSQYSDKSNNPQPSAPYFTDEPVEIAPHYNEAVTFLTREHKESQM